MNTFIPAIVVQWENGFFLIEFDGSTLCDGMFFISKLCIFFELKENILMEPACRRRCTILRTL